MRYVLIEYLGDVEIDDPTDVYSELDDDRMEVRRVEFYASGECFSYGAERGGEEVLKKEPFPEDIRVLADESAGIRVNVIPPRLFFDVWNAAQERQDNFMTMFY